MKKTYIAIGIVLLLAGIVWWFFGGPSYYVYHAESADQCLEGEAYNAEERVCYFDFYCDSDEACRAVDMQYQEIFDAMASAYVAQGGAQKSHEEGYDEMKQITEAYPAVPLQVAGIPELMQNILPEEYQSFLPTITEETDGLDGTLAYVEPQDESGQMWRMVYDPVDTFTEDGEYRDINELLTTLVHELAHVVMLKEDQVEHVAPEIEYIECEDGQTILDEGCAIESAYVTKFIDTFWSERDRRRAFRASYRGNEEGFAYRTFSRNPERYVTEYAATNAVEDAAESFALFVLGGVPDIKEISDVKIVFFYRYPELVDLRNHIRAGISETLQGAYLLDGAQAESEA